MTAKLPPLGDGPRGSRKGQCPVTPDCALCAQSARRKAAWSQTYRHSATGLMARRSGAAPSGWPTQTAIRRQASWLAAKASMDLKSRWPFVLQKYQAASKHPNPQGLRMPPPTMNQNSRPLISAAKSSSHAVASQPARGAYAPRRLRTGKSAHSSLWQSLPAETEYLNSQGVRMPTANCGGAERR